MFHVCQVMRRISQFLDSVRTLNQFIEGERSNMPAVACEQPLPLGDDSAWENDC